ncbi:hypothetical protein Nepgr_029233 [Nepenthes gracilis]|uniref:Uncharacterized protein n=1 Tax=Nepenthes gracilis TaxID=150966 RepID=A0AAD3Y4N7_NEPGR|nr:hypothetical protein Nepgr_029233 [Nepenthes gracilis]
MKEDASENSPACLPVWKRKKLKEDLLHMLLKHWCSNQLASLFSLFPMLPIEEGEWALVVYTNPLRQNVVSNIYVDLAPSPALTIEVHFGSPISGNRGPAYTNGVSGTSSSVP